MLKRVVLVLLQVATVATLHGAAIKESKCVFNDPLNPPAGFSCNIFPSKAGVFDANVRINFPKGFNSLKDPITPGYVILDGNPSGINPVTGIDPNMDDWTQVLEFVDPPRKNAEYSAQYMILYTEGCSVDLADGTCFPALDQILKSDSYVFYTEPANGVFNYNPCPDCTAIHTYKIHLPASAAADSSDLELGQVAADAAVVTPEPGTFAVIAGALAFIVGIRRFRSRQFVG